MKQTTLHRMEIEVFNDAEALSAFVLANPARRLIAKVLLPRDRPGQEHWLVETHSSPAAARTADEAARIAARMARREYSRRAQVAHRQARSVI